MKSKYPLIKLKHGQLQGAGRKGNDQTHLRHGIQLKIYRRKQLMLRLSISTAANHPTTIYKPQSTIHNLISAGQFDHL